ncbi:MAG: hypothetical protein WAV76_01015 [Bacteroidota bacterium]
MSTSLSFSIFGGASFPMGDFASTSSGLAETGYAGGIQFVTGGQVGLLVSALYAANSVDVSDIQGGNSTANWQNIMALLGLKIGTANASGANFFVAPLIGIDFAKSPTISSPASDNPYISTVYDGYTFYGYIPVSGQKTLNSASATALTYGAMMEIELGHVTLGARYLICKPHFNVSMTGTLTGSSQLYNPSYGYATFTDTETINESLTMDQSTSIIIAYLGIAF